LASNGGRPDPKEVEDAYKKARNTLTPLFLSRRGAGNWEPNVLEHMLMPPLEGVYHAFKKDKEGGINRGWCGNVFFAWDEQLAKNYPFNPKAGTEAKIADVASF